MKTGELTSVACRSFLTDQKENCITVTIKRDGDNFFALYNGSTEYAVTVAASRYIALNPDVFEAVRFVKIVSNAPGGEDALRTIYIISGER